MEDDALMVAIFHASETTSVLTAIAPNADIAREYVQLKTALGETGYYVAGFKPLSKQDMAQLRVDVKRMKRKAKVKAVNG